MEELSPQVRGNFNVALGKLTGQERRSLAAKICIEFFDRSPTKMERELRVGREMVKLGLHEHDSGIKCLDAYTLRGAKKKRNNT